MTAAAMKFSTGALLIKANAAFAIAGGCIRSAIRTIATLAPTAAPIVSEDPGRTACAASPTSAVATWQKPTLWGDDALTDGLVNTSAMLEAQDAKKIGRPAA